MQAPFRSLPNASTLVAACAVATLAGCATLSAPSVPGPLQVAGGEKVAMKADAKGFQTYRCTASAQDPAKLAWVYQGPEATLTSGGKEIGKIVRGPVFEGSDGSKATAKVKAQSPAPGFAVPWTLYNVESTSGTGSMSKVSSIQMVDTTGGRAPEGPCSNNQKDVTIRVNYGATYYFYSK
jgi:hypothetical protein